MTNLGILQHTPEEGPGTLNEWAEQRGVTIDKRSLFDSANFSQTEAWSGVVVLGGTMNVDDHQNFPWLAREKDFIEQIFAKKLPALGLCLGGQMFSQVLGARVMPSGFWEVGWHEVQRLPTAPPVTFLSEWPERLKVFQWHEDQFELPVSAQRIFTNDICLNQGFVWDDRVIGLQFHPEAKQDWIQNSFNKYFSRNQLAKQKFVQPPEQAVPKHSEFAGPVRQAFFALLDRLFLK